ncbi:MAG: hypothetical protein HYV09_09915 [Deltaproteobacteria bacterium]|nr:hypothetical protein [Deltaproteobacteria bacterium]
MTSLRRIALVAACAVASSTHARSAHAGDAPLDDPGADLPVAPAPEKGGEAGAAAAQPTKAPVAPADFLVEMHGWLRVVHHPSTFEAVRQVVHAADATRASLATMLGQSVLEHVELRVARTPEEMLVLAPSEAPPAANTTAATYPALSLIVLSARSVEGDPGALGEAFHHQLAHVALFDAAAGRPLPRWLQEGFAVQASGEHGFSRAQMLWSAHVRGGLQPFSSLDEFPEAPRAARIAWAQSADFVRFLVRDQGGTRFAAAVARTRGGDAFERALGDSYGADLRTLEQKWRDDVATRNVTGPLAVSAAVGWGLAVAVIVRRRRKRRAAPIEEELAPTVVEQRKSEPRLLVADRGLGHVVYIVERKGVPKVEHDGKHHTLH